MGRCHFSSEQEVTKSLSCEEVIDNHNGSKQVTGYLRGELSRCIRISTDISGSDPFVALPAAAAHLHHPGQQMQV